MCASMTTYTALRNSGARPGEVPNGAHHGAMTICSVDRNVGSRVNRRNLRFLEAERLATQARSELIRIGTTPRSIGHASWVCVTAWLRIAVDRRVVRVGHFPLAVGGIQHFTQGLEE